MGYQLAEHAVRDVFTEIKMAPLIYMAEILCLQLCQTSKLNFEPHREKTGFLPMRKQRRRSASQ